MGGSGAATSATPPAAGTAAAAAAGGQPRSGSPLPAAPTPAQVAGLPPAAPLVSPPQPNPAMRPMQQPAASGPAARLAGAGSGSSAAAGQGGPASGASQLAVRAAKIRQKRLADALEALGQAEEPASWHAALRKLHLAGKGGAALQVRGIDWSSSLVLAGCTERAMWFQARTALGGTCCAAENNSRLRVCCCACPCFSNHLSPPCLPHVLPAGHPEPVAAAVTGGAAGCV